MEEHHSLVSDLLKGLPLSFLKLHGPTSEWLFSNSNTIMAYSMKVKPLRNAQQ